MAEFFFNIGNLPSRQEQFTAEDINFDEATKSSLLATPVWANLEFPAGSYTDLDGNVVEYPGLRIDSVVMTVSTERTIVRTAVAGRSGTVKEYISDGDYIIKASGILVGETIDRDGSLEMSDIGAALPESDLRALILISRATKSIPVVSEFLGFFDIEEIVISAVSWPQVSGVRNAQGFSLDMYSDEPVELVQEDV
jgi:hypothetical protein